MLCILGRAAAPIVAVLCLLAPHSGAAAEGDGDRSAIEALDGHLAAETEKLDADVAAMKSYIAGLREQLAARRTADSGASSPDDATGGSRFVLTEGTGKPRDDTQPSSEAETSRPAPATPDELVPHNTTRFERACVPPSLKSCKWWTFTYQRCRQ